MSIVHLKSIKNCLNYGINELKLTSQSPELDGEILLAAAINKPKEYLYTYPEKYPTYLQIKKFRQMINRRKKYEPIAYIIGYKYFYGLKFKVNKHTLIPRPETELMVEKTLNILNNISHGSTILIDIGSGTGCIPIAIAKNIQNRSLKIFASDISAQALKTAKKNAKKNKADKKIKFLKGNLLELAMEIINNTRGGNIIITANLPYLPSSLYKTTLPNVILYEPKLALDGGKDGLKYYRALFKQIKKIQSDFLSFYILCEIDPSQKNSIPALVKKYFPSAKIETKKDLAGLARLAIIEH
ncbi:MAG: peptide chain release factor N(5)-glutamine methyltransferase [bacterium]